MLRDPIMDKIHISCVGDSLVAKGERVLLSMSAGKDSVAMFHLIHEVSDEMNLTIGVFHLNHGTRGEDSDADETFVRELCDEFGYTFFAYREAFNPTEPSFEKRARERRYELLMEIADKNKYDKIMTAHTKSDQAETVLMRLFTGTHISGLCSIPETRGKIVRPLLKCNSEEIVSYLTRNGFKWREDRSNEDTGYTRNFIRHRVLPLITSRFPRSWDTIPEIADAAKENLSLIEEMAEICGMKFKYGNSSAQIDFGRKNVSRVIFNWGAARLFAAWNKYVSRERLNESWRKFQTESRYAILFEEKGIVLEKDSREGTLVLRMRKLTRFDNSDDINVIIPVTKFGSMDQTLRIYGFDYHVSEIEYDEFLIKRSNPGIFFLGRNEDEKIEYRFFINGDRMLVNGSYKKVKYLMNDNKCSPDEKKMIPIFIVGNRVAAIPFSIFNRGPDRIADDRLVDSSSKKILAICYTRIENER